MAIGTKRKVKVPVVIFATVGILCMLGALGLAVLAYTSAGSGTSAAGPTSQIVVATHDISIGSKLSADDVTLVSYPSSTLPTNYVGNISDVVNYFAAITLSKNDPVLRTDVTNKAGSGPQFIGTPLTQQLQRPGDDIVSLPFDPLSMGGGYLQTGDHVDVYSAGVVQVLDAIVMRVGTPDEVTAVRAPSVILLEAKPDGIAKVELLVSSGSKFSFILLPSSG